jgi:hypothetical protein
LTKAGILRYYPTDLNFRKSNGRIPISYQDRYYLILSSAKIGRTATEQRAFLLLFRRSRRRKPWISAAHEVPLAVSFWKNSEKQRELTRNPLVFSIVQAFAPRDGLQAMAAKAD